MEHEKKQRIKDAINEIQKIARQKELLNAEQGGYFQILKELGFPKNIVNKIIKERRKTRYQIESERILEEQLGNLLGD